MAPRLRCQAPAGVGLRARHTIHTRLPRPVCSTRTLPATPKETSRSPAPGWKRPPAAMRAARCSFAAGWTAGGGRSALLRAHCKSGRPPSHSIRARCFENTTGRHARRRSTPATNAHLGSRWQARASVRAPAAGLPGYPSPRACRAAGIEIQKSREGAGAGGAGGQRTHPGAGQGNAGLPRAMKALSAPPAACRARHTAPHPRSPRFSLPDFRRRALRRTFRCSRKQQYGKTAPNA